MRHELKTWPEYYEAVVRGEKPFEIRVDDREGGYNVGDTLALNEWDRLRGYSGRCTEVVVSYILRGPKFGIAEGHVVMGILPPGGDAARRRARVSFALDVAALASLWLGLLAMHAPPMVAVVAHALASVLVGAATFVRGRS